MPCIPFETCLLSNQACAGTCPSGESLCSTTDLCYPMTREEPCDANICLNGQTLIQRSNSTRYCSVSSTLPIEGQYCTGPNQIYCEELKTCSNLTAPHLCKLCPSDMVACPDTNECVSNSTYCCGHDHFYCEVLSDCIFVNKLCHLPNIAPKISSLELIYISSIDLYSKEEPEDNGRMVGLILGNGHIAVDEQNEELSMVVTEVSNISMDAGEWQYSLCNAPFDMCQNCSQLSGQWRTLTNVSEDHALYLPSTACLRFWRKSMTLEQAVWLRIRLWDGNTDGYLSNSTTQVRYITPFYDTVHNDITGTSSISMNSTIAVILLLPQIDTPQFHPNATLELTPIHEDVSLVDNFGNDFTDIIVSVTAEYLPLLNDSFIPGLPNVFYQNLIPDTAKYNYYNRISLANSVRENRIKALNSNQGPGVAVSLLNGSTKNWQVSFNGDPQLYVYISDLLTSYDELLLLNTTASLRYLPSSNFNGKTELVVRAWDGVIPATVMQSMIHGSSVYVASTSAFTDYHHIGVAKYVTIDVQSIYDPPIITQSTINLPPLPYAIKYTYKDAYVALINSSIQSLRPNKYNIEDILYLVVEELVTVHHFYSASETRYYKKFIFGYVIDYFIEHLWHSLLMVH